MTIVYSVHTDELNPVPNPKPCNDISTKIDMVKYHLGLLMSTHLKNHPDNDHTDIDDDPCKLMKTVKRVRPP